MGYLLAASLVMANGFPARRMTRTMYRLYDEVDFWKRTYEQWERNEVDQHRVFLYSRRATALGEIRLALLHVRDLLTELPRLS